MTLDGLTTVHLVRFILLLSNACCYPLPWQNLSFAHPADHLCFDRTTYDNINGPGGPFMLDIVGLAGPLMYLDQISRDISRNLKKLNQCFKFDVFINGWMYLCYCTQ